MLTHVKVQQQLQAYQQSIQAGRNSPCRCAVQCVWQSRAIAGPAHILQCQHASPAKMQIAS